MTVDARAAGFRIYSFKKPIVLFRLLLNYPQIVFVLFPLGPACFGCLRSPGSWASWVRKRPATGPRRSIKDPRLQKGTKRDRIMDPILPLLSILGYWAMILGPYGGPGIRKNETKNSSKFKKDPRLRRGESKTQNRPNRPEATPQKTLRTGEPKQTDKPSSPFQRLGFLCCRQGVLPGPDRGRVERGPALGLYEGALGPLETRSIGTADARGSEALAARSSISTISSALGTEPKEQPIFQLFGVYCSSPCWVGEGSRGGCFGVEGRVYIYELRLLCCVEAFGFCDELRLRGFVLS